MEQIPKGELESETPSSEDQALEPLAQTAENTQTADTGPKMQSPPPLWTASPQQPSNQKSGNAAITAFLLVLFFLFGLAMGFFGRPILVNDLDLEVVVTVEPVQVEVLVTPTPGGQAVAEANNGSAAETNNGNADSQPNANGEVAATPTIMEYLMEDARHIQGDPDAPITLIEFSDFK